MTPAEFKQRFIELLPPGPEELREELFLEEFVTYDKSRVDELRISPADRGFLTESGLPRQCAPFLSFGLPPAHVLQPLDGFPAAVMIGSNGSGDMICVDQDDGAVVYFNHDFHMQRVLMNSSLAQFAESICLFAEFMRTKNLEVLWTHFPPIDSAGEAYDFWMTEAEMIAAVD